MKKIAACLISALILWGIFVQTANSSSTPPIKLGVEVSQDTHFPSWDPIIQALGKAAGVQIDLVYYKNPYKMKQDLANGKIGVAYLKIAQAELMREKSPYIELIATAITEDPKTGERRTTYDTFVIAANNSNINSLQDLNHQSIAYWDQHSASNYAVIKEKLTEQGIHVHWLKVPTRHAAYIALLRGRAQATGTWDYAHKIHPHHEKMKVIATFSDLQNPVLAINTLIISPEQKRQIQKTLLSFRAHSNIVGFEPMT